MRTLYLASVFLHVLAAAVWIGGMLFLALVLVPVARQPGFREGAGALFHALGVRFRPIGWGCLAVLVATGIVQLGARGYGWADLSGRLWQGTFGFGLAVKLGATAAALALSAYHDFVVGPRATALWRAGDDPVAAERLRRGARRIGRATLLLALVAVALGVTLVRGVP